VVTFSRVAELRREHQALHASVILAPAATRGAGAPRRGVKVNGLTTRRPLARVPARATKTKAASALSANRARV